MFIFPENPIQRAWLIGLLLLWAALLFGGFLFGPQLNNRRMPTWTRMASSLTLVAAALSWLALGYGGANGRFLLLLAVGMGCGFLGDLWLAGLLPGGRNVLAGMAAFGLGHVLYISVFWQAGNAYGLDGAAARWGALAVWLLIGLAGWYLMVFRGAEAGVLHWAALPYALLLAGTAGVASGLALQNGVFVPLAVGAALFLLSDLILAGEMFSGLRFRLIGDVVWLTYGPAQMLIVYTAGALLRFFP
jgi:hypothetical protein